MKRKWFAFSTIAAIAMVGMFVFENTAAAHREVHSKREYRKDNARATRGRIATLNPVATLNQSWIDLTFGVGLDTETLAKVHPIYQKTRETLQTQIKEAKEARESDEKREAVKKLRESIKETQTQFYASLKEVLTEEQMTKLTELTKKRRTEARKRVNELRRSQRESRRHR